MNQIFIVTEHIESGIELNKYIKTNQMNEESASVVVFKILSAVRYLHSYGVIHRDINPENILVIDRHNIKLIEFRFSKILGPNQKCDEPFGNIVIYIFNI